MNSEPVRPSRYDRTTIALHWGVALGVVFQWLGARSIDLFPAGAERVDARSVHILIGTALSAAVVFRIWWRASRGRRLPADRPPALAMASRAAHLTLYVLLIATLGLGLATAWIRGDSILGWFQISRLGDFPVAARHALANQFTGLHRLAANLILGLAAAHSGAALLHHIWLKDEVLNRMGLATGSRPGRAPRAGNRPAL
jgi:cytochrome b561